MVKVVSNYFTLSWPNFSYIFIYKMKNRIYIIKKSYNHILFYSFCIFVVLRVCPQNHNHGNRLKTIRNGVVPANWEGSRWGAERLRGQNRRNSRIDPKPEWLWPRACFGGKSTAAKGSGVSGESQQLRSDWTAERGRERRRTGFGERNGDIHYCFFWELLKLCTRWR